MDINSVKLDPLKIGKALKVLYGSLNVREFNEEWNKLVRYSRVYPKESRDVRAALTHHKDNIGDLNNEKYVKLLRYMQGLETKYGSRSIVLRTLMNAVSACERTIEDVQKEYKNSTDPPPAYDKSKRHYLSDFETDAQGIGRKIRRTVIQWIRDNINDDLCLSEMAELFDPNRKTIKRIQNRPKHFATLKNGSKTPIRVKGMDVLDIESMCYIPDNENPEEFSKLINFYNVENYSDTDDRRYLIWDSSRIKNCNGVHTVVSDKDGKAREVYYTTVVRAVIGKAIMDQLDSKLREIPGFYTYDQTRMILRIVRKGWNTSKIIITIDMEKFSDTIIRRFMFDIIEALGLPHDIRNQWENLLDVSIYDEIRNHVLGHNDVVLQGQYTVFMLMSCLNLCLQRYINYKYNHHYDPTYSGVLGDDTIMIFDSGEVPLIQADIENIYGSFGMKINILKSDTLIFGSGQGQFAKEDFDKYGIIHRLNPKNVENQNIDGVINDVIGLNRSDVETHAMLSQLFGNKAVADEIIDYHILNGGLYDGPIRKQDINIFKNNINRIQIKLTNKITTMEEKVLDNLVKLYDQLDLDLSDSPLVMFLSSDQIEQLGSLQLRCSTNEEIVNCTNEFIITIILSMDRIGANIDFSLLDALEGKYLQDLQETYDQYLNNHFYYNQDVELYKNLIQFDRFMAKRKMGIKGRYSSIFIPCITGEVQLLKKKPLDRSLISEITDIEGRDQYWASVSEEMRGRLIRILNSLGYMVTSRYYGRNKCCWIGCYMRNNGDEWFRFNVHQCHSPNYEPVYRDMNTPFKVQLLGDLRRVGIDITIEKIKTILMRF